MGHQNSDNHVKLDGFNREFDRLYDFFREKGFYKNPNTEEISVFGRFLDYKGSIGIILERLYEEITIDKKNTSYIIERAIKRENIYRIFISTLESSLILLHDASKHHSNMLDSRHTTLYQKATQTYSSLTRSSSANLE